MRYFNVLWVPIKLGQGAKAFQFNKLVNSFE